MSYTHSVWEKAKIYFSETLPFFYGEIRRVLKGSPYSQFGEDVFLSNLLVMKEIKEISYLDLGAGHPIIGSNTFWMYRRGASGIVVDANKSLIDKHSRIRSRDQQIFAVVGGNEDVVDFAISSNWSFSKRADLSGKLHYKETVSVNQILVQSLVDKFSTTDKWLLNLDVEGLEVEILESLSFAKTRPMVCLIETTKSTQTKIDCLMNKWEFRIITKLGMTSIYT